MFSIEEHISNQIHKTYAKSGVLRRIRRFVPKNVTLRLYKSFISPHLDYCFPLFWEGGESRWIGWKMLIMTFLGPCWVLQIYFIGGSVMYYFKTWKRYSTGENINLLSCCKDIFITTVLSISRTFSRQRNAIYFAHT